MEFLGFIVLAIIVYVVYTVASNAGYRKGKREGSRKGYGVGYNRGRRRSPSSGCLLVIVVAVISAHAIGKAIADILE